MAPLAVSVLSSAALPRISVPRISLPGAVRAGAMSAAAALPTAARTCSSSARRRAVWLAALLAACGAPAAAQTPQAHDHAPAAARASAAPAADRAGEGTRDPALPPASGQAAAAVEVPLDPARIAALPQVQAEGRAHGQRLECSGVSLAALLRASGALPDGPLRGAQLARVVVATARDGYRVAFSLAELDPATGGHEVLLSRRCNGADLPAEDGPWRLLAPRDARPARWVRQVESIRVVDAP